MERRVTRATSPKAGSTVSSAPQNPPSRLQLGRDVGRHALAVEIEQRERRSAIDDISAGAGDDVRPGDAIDQLLLGGDLHLVGQVGAQCAERDRLRRLQAFDQRAKRSDAGNLDALGRAPRHHAGGTVFLERAVRRQ